MEKLWMGSINSVRNLKIIYFSKKIKKLKRLKKDEKSALEPHYPILLIGLGKSRKFQICLEETLLIKILQELALTSCVSIQCVNLYKCIPHNQKRYNDMILIWFLHTWHMNIVLIFFILRVTQWVLKTGCLWTYAQIQYEFWLL